MTLSAVDREERTARIAWSDGRVERFHFVWLRDNAPVDANLDPRSGERLVDFHRLPADPRPETLEIDGKGDLVVRWADLDEPAVYAADWLAAHAYSPDARAARAGLVPAPRPWPFAERADAPEIPFAALMAGGADELAWLRAFRTYGIGFIVGAPAETGVVERLTRHFGYTREVVFGFIRDLKSAPRYDSVGFTSRGVPPHIDAVNYREPYDLQFLHCIHNDADGGDSYVIDGFAVAERLRREDPEAFDTLVRVDVDYMIGAGRHDVRASAPVIDLDRHGRVRVVRFSNQERRALSVPHEDVEPFYAAYRAFSARVNDPANRLEFRFSPGDVLMFDNHRALHARTPFDPHTGARFLQLGTSDRDLVDSRIRVLSRAEGRGANGAAAPGPA